MHACFVVASSAIQYFSCKPQTDNFSRGASTEFRPVIVLVLVYSHTHKQYAPLMQQLTLHLHDAISHAMQQHCPTMAK